MKWEDFLVNKIENAINTKVEPSTVSCQLLTI